MGRSLDQKKISISSVRRHVKTLPTVIVFLLVRALYILHRRRLSSSIPAALREPRRPFLAFSGCGLLMAYYHGIATYIRDHFRVENLQLSAISGGCSTILALAMGIDLYQILLLGLHLKKKYLKEGIYLNNFDSFVEDLCSKFAEVGITDEDVAQLSARNQCFVGVTQCFPFGHRCIGVPSTCREMAALWLCSMSVMPFFKTPGVYQDSYCIDGGFSAVYSVPDGQPWDDVVKITCLPWWATIFPPAMNVADLQPSRFMPTEILILYSWAHQRTLIWRGYDDAQKSHGRLVSRGLQPLPNAPLTPWSEWDLLFSKLDENDLPPLSAARSTKAASPMEEEHLKLLRTYSLSSDLCDAMRGPRLRRLGSSELGSQSDDKVVSLPSRVTGAIRDD